MVCPQCKREYGMAAFYCEACRLTLVREGGVVTEDERDRLELERSIPFEERGRTYAEHLRVLEGHDAGAPSHEAGPQGATGPTEKRYPALRAIAASIQVIAVLPAVAVAIGAVLAAHYGVAPLLAVLIVGGATSALLWVLLKSYSELIYVQIDIESNTRRTAELLEAAPRRTG